MVEKITLRLVDFLVFSLAKSSCQRPDQRQIRDLTIYPVFLEAVLRAEEARFAHLLTCGALK